MDADSELIELLHHELIANPKAAEPLQLLTQIYAKHGGMTEAVETARNLLEVDGHNLHGEIHDHFHFTFDRPIDSQLDASSNSSSSNGPPSYEVATGQSSSTPQPTSTTHVHFVAFVYRPTSGVTQPINQATNAGDVPREFLSSSSSQRSSFDFIATASSQGSLISAPSLEPTSPYSPAQFRSNNSNSHHNGRTQRNPPRPQCPPVRDVYKIAEAMAADPRSSLNTAIDGLAEIIPSEFARSNICSVPSGALRASLLERTEYLSMVLHPNYAHLAPLALTHVEHEHATILDKRYANDATMLLAEPISSIPRTRFLATEDGYAWDTAELVDALRAGGGAMRNPLSRAPFSTRDVRLIIRHPLGRGLAAAHVRQDQLRRGLRPETLKHLKELAAALLEDQSDNAAAATGGLDEFFGYMARLPWGEREALDKLRVPARDKHTGLGYDDSVGDMLRDAKAGTVCWHKCGDFLEQCVQFLREG